MRHLLATKEGWRGQQYLKVNQFWVYTINLKKLCIFFTYLLLFSDWINSCTALLNSDWRYSKPHEIPPCNQGRLTWSTMFEGKPILNVHNKTWRNCVSFIYLRLFSDWINSCTALLNSNWFKLLNLNLNLDLDLNLNQDLRPDIIPSFKSTSCYKTRICNM